MTRRLDTTEARALETCLQTGDTIGLRVLLPNLPPWDMLPPWPVLCEQAAALLYLTAGAALALKGGPHNRAAIAAAWAEARPGILADLAGAYPAEHELAAPLSWIDGVLGGDLEWVPAYDLPLHAAVALRVAALIWDGQPRPWAWLAQYLAQDD